MARIAVIDYGAGNLHSVMSGFERVMQPADTIALVHVPYDLASFSHIVLPGVGAYGDCIGALQSVEGMIEALEMRVLKEATPFLGICVGMQMLFERGLEHGEHTGLGWFTGEVVRLAPVDAILKIPHMGWNELHLHQQHPITAGLGEGEHAYFVHSYHVTGVKVSEVLITTDYGGEVVAMVGRDNIIGTQFHPEKSQHVGAKVLDNFLQMR
jgi:imidazole glycerol-phosphate synthase subunit HisH